jgi:hypothetical protein
MSRYPQSIAELDLDAVVIVPEIIAAVKRFAASKPYRGLTPERVEKFRTTVFAQFIDNRRASILWLDLSYRHHAAALF